MVDPTSITVALCGLSTDPLRNAIEAAGYRVIAADNYATVLPEAAPDRPLVILFDTEGAGFDVLTALSRSSAHPGVFPVVLSKEHSAEAIVAAMRTGAVDYVVKDSNGHYRADMVRRLLGLRLHTPALPAGDLARRFRSLSRELSHDLRNPLGNALGYVELLADMTGDKLTPDQKQFLTRIKANCDMALQLIAEFVRTTEKITAPDE